MSFFFHDMSRRGPGALCAIYFESKGTTDESARSALIRDVASRLENYGTHDGKSLVRRLAETKPRPLLEEMDRIAQAFGSDDHHHAPTSRVRARDKRLAVIAESVLARGTWMLESPSMWLRRDEAVFGQMSPMPSSYRDRPELSSMVFVPNGKASGLIPEPYAAAQSHGYVDSAGEGHDDLALMKLQPLSLRAALTEARLIEQLVAR